ncbi:MAG TPA: hypothetical protein PKE40_01090 [Arachnia sp.]|nr:hypothetical protein [Arachnia sp.]HMT84922.1 hypothetical protein [Arachnia sp.]
MDDPTELLNQQLDQLDRDLDKELARRLREGDPELTKVARMVWREWERVTQERGHGAEERLDWGFAFELIVKQKEAWLTRARLGNPATELSVDEALDWIVGCCLTHGPARVRRLARRWRRTGTFDPLSGDDEPSGPEVGEPDTGFDQVDDSSLPITTVVAWVASGRARDVHVFRFNPQQSAAMGMARLEAKGWDSRKKSELAEAAEQVASSSGGMITAARAMRLWKEARGKLGEVLYLLGGLGPVDALKTTKRLHSTAVRVDEVYRGQWKGNTITVLKLASRVSVPTDTGAEVRRLDLLAFVYEEGGDAEKLSRAIEERGFGFGDGAFDAVRDAEEEFRGTLGSPARPKREVSAR